MARRHRNPMGSEIEAVDDALVVSFGAGRARGISRPAGVFDAAGAPVPRAQCRRASRLAVTTPPPLPDVSEVTETLAGTWLFGGMLYGHFGHFLCESTGRLWGLEVAGERIDGVIFHAKKEVNRPARFLDPVLPWLAIAGVRLPVRLPMAPCRVERLLIPDQGFGTGDMIGGTPEYHAYVRSSFGADIAAKGPEAIYISRSALYSKRGRILGETRLEAFLAAQGYATLHPQEHPIEDQIARYKAARRIISTDCSALHLAAFFARPTDRIAIVARRPGETVEDFTAQYRSFSGVDPLVVQCIRRLYSYDGAKIGQMSEVYSEIDFAGLQEALQSAGFVAPGAPWAGPTPDEITDETRDLGERLGKQVHPLDQTVL